MKLELKHLAGYLPYGLKILIHGTEEVLMTGLETETPSTQEKIIYKNSERNFYKTYFYEIVPILRPLSDLTKEIEINGEKFVPIYKLFEIKYKDTHHVDLIREMYFKVNYTFTCSSHYGTAMETSINTKYIQMNNFWKIQKLLEWNFDIHGLIENNLAIDINTL